RGNGLRRRPDARHCFRRDAESGGGGKPNPGSTPDRDEGYISLRRQRSGFAQGDEARMADARSRLARRPRGSYRCALREWNHARGMEERVRDGDKLDRKLGYEFAMAVACRRDAGQGYRESEPNRDDDYEFE